jgi:DeoR/GlpR family transcriptional regulator of sugar metabolism
MSPDRRKRAERWRTAVEHGADIADLANAWNVSQTTVREDIASLTNGRKGRRSPDAPAAEQPTARAGDEAL